MGIKSYISNCRNWIYCGWYLSYARFLSYAWYPIFNLLWNFETMEKMPEINYSSVYKYASGYIIYIVYILYGDKFIVWKRIYVCFRTCMEKCL